MCDLTDYECAYGCREEHISHLCRLQTKLNDMFDQYNITERDRGRIDTIIGFIREEMNAIDRFDDVLANLEDKKVETEDSKCVFDNLYL